jgi:hypothetical protein
MPLGAVWNHALLGARHLGNASLLLYLIRRELYVVSIALSGRNPGSMDSCWWI